MIQSFSSGSAFSGMFGAKGQFQLGTYQKIIGCCLALFVFVGCGGSGGVELAPVTGVVTLDGDPISGVEVTFEPQNDRPDGGGSSYAFTDAQGRYRLSYPGGKSGAVVGNHRVRVSAGEQEDGSVTKIPAKYGAKTELTREVTSGSNEINLELTSR